jgi:hypothetical protein
VVEAMLSDGELFDLLEKAESRVDRYWNFYSLATLGAAGWLLSGSGLPHGAVPWVVAAGLGIFFASNLCAISLVEARIGAIEAEVAARVQKAEVQSDRLRACLLRPSLPHRRLASVVVHALVDVAVIALVFIRAT